MLYGERRHTIIYVRLLLVGFIKTVSPRIRVPLPRASHFNFIFSKVNNRVGDLQSSEEISSLACLLPFIRLKK